MELTIGGTTYRQLSETTIEQDHAIMKVVRGMGVEELAMRDGESPEQFAERVFDELMQDGRAFTLLGCFLVPVGGEWSRDNIAVTAQAMRSATSAEDKAKIRSMVFTLLVGFLAGGLTSVVIFRRSFDRLRGIVGQPQSSAEPSTTASGRILSVQWLVGIPRRLWRWLAGRFGTRS